MPRMSYGTTESALYCAFISRFGQKTGGHIEIENDIAFFGKKFKLRSCEPQPQEISRSKDLAKDDITSSDNIRCYYRTGFWTNIPIFGKRGIIPSDLLKTHKYIIITDSRCLIPFLQSMLSKKYIIFKSHGSMSAYFASYLVGALKHETSYLKKIYLILMYAFLVIIFMLIENLIYIYSTEIYIMRTRKSLQRNIFGKLMIILYGQKIVYGSCFTALMNSCFDYNGNKNININNEKLHAQKVLRQPSNSLDIYNISRIKRPGRKFLMVGDWTLPNNIYSLKHFLTTALFYSGDELNIAGKLHPQIFKKELQYFKSTNNLEFHILGYISKNVLEALKYKSDYMLCINLYGSGIPIKVIEAIDESKKYGYQTLLSKYSASSIEGFNTIYSYLVYDRLNTLELD